MRMLTNSELNLVAGGWGSSDSGYYEDIIVTGYRFDWGWMFSSSWIETPTPPGGGGGGGAAQDTSHQQTETANNTPCVDEFPAGMDGADVAHLNDLAKYSASQIAALQESTGHEWGAFIYRASDGQLYQTDPFTAGQYDNMDGAQATMPSGAVIVGYLHTHPTDATMDERNLSTADRDFIRDLINDGGTNISADANMLAYVVTSDESTSYKTYVYDKSKRSSGSPGCTL